MVSNCGVHTVDASDALDEAGWIPRDVVIDDDVGAVQVDAFGKHFGGDQNAVLVFGLKRAWRRSWR